MYTYYVLVNKYTWTRIHEYLRGNTYVEQIIVVY